MTQMLTGISNCAYIAQIYPAAYSYGMSGPGVVFVNNIFSGSTTYPGGQLFMVRSSKPDDPADIREQRSLQLHQVLSSGLTALMYHQARTAT